MHKFGLLMGVMSLAMGVVGGSTEHLRSPDGTIEIVFKAGEGPMTWSLYRNGKTIVSQSPLGLSFADSMGRGGKSAELWRDGFSVLAARRRSVDEERVEKVYRREKVRDRYNELELDLARGEHRLGMVFRAYDEGAAFRYVIPAQKDLPGFQLMEEFTQWRFPSETKGWFTCYGGVSTSQEEEFKLRAVKDIGAQELVGMPAIARVSGQCAAVCEAALVDWAGLFLRAAEEDGASVLKAMITPLPKSEAATPGVAVIRTTPAASPWRVTICGDNELDLTRHNDIIRNLNPPPEEGIDFSWVRPGPSSWDWWTESNNSLSTELTLKLIDFAAEMGWPYHTIDGGWYGFARRPNHGPGVRLEPRPGFDLARIVRHASEKGVGVWVWIHWELINDVGIEETFSRLEKWGIKGVKTDFLNRQDQWIVNWYERVCRAAARHHVLVNFHGAFKPTGTERTWPNNLTREGILGNEFNIFNTRITPRHVATLPFTRFLLGPADFTPGSFGNVFSKDFMPQVKKGHRYGDETDRCPHWAEERGTRAHALALCVAFDSGLMTLCDWPERYRGAPGVEALRNLPAAWRRTTPLAGECGEYYAVGREAFDGRRYLAAFTVERRKMKLPLDFLGEGRYRAVVYADDPVRTPANAKALAISEREVTAADSLDLELVDEGGALVVFERR